MTDLIKTLVGAATVWPLFYIVTLAVTLFNMGGAPSPTVMLVAFGLHILTTLVMFAIPIGYTVHAVLNDRLETSHKIAWSIGFILTGSLSATVYWFKHVSAAEGDEGDEGEFSYPTPPPLHIGRRVFYQAPEA